MAATRCKKSDADPGRVHIKHQNEAKMWGKLNVSQTTDLLGFTYVKQVTVQWAEMAYCSEVRGV